MLANTNTMFSPPTTTGFLQLNSPFSSFLLPSNQRVLYHGRGGRRLGQLQTCRQSMFLNTKPVLKDGTLSINGEEALTGVPDNVVITPLTDSSAFVGATSTGDASSRLVFKLGVIEDVRLLCIFRFKIWWMIPRMGNSGSDIPIETQMLLLEAREGAELDAKNKATSYIIFLPVLDGEFRSSLQGNPSNELQFCVESGDPEIVTSESLKAVFVNYGNHPFDLIKESMNMAAPDFCEFKQQTEDINHMRLILEQQFGTFSLRETKQLPGMLDWFGWCTWDAFYMEVHPQGIKDGLKSLSQGGTPARFLIIDDGWQDTINEFQKEGEPFVEGSQHGGRLLSIEENNKFRRTENEPQSEAQAPSSLKDFVTDIKRTFGLSSKRSAITRASDDYYPSNPTTQTLHIAAVAFNSIFLGEVVVPDWDMFYSKHDAAEFHAVARAVGGCGVYVSDKPGQHDFKVLKRLVLPNGLVLRAKYPGRPTRDCLFNDPVMDGKSLLKIWNLNKCTGVLGVFNCQGAGTWPCSKSNAQEDLSSELSVKVSPTDIEYFEEVSGNFWTGDCAVFSSSTGSLLRLSKEEKFDVTLKVLQCDVFTVTPIKVYNKKIQFAPIGLINMYNSGGAIEAIDFFSDSSSCKIHVKGRGSGNFGAYSSTKPKSCLINSKIEEFDFRDEDNLLTLIVPDRTSSWDIAICY
ncbi:putative galactinol--sucrose galactosyltransferase 2 isoform X3 [Castanea sativa]|uniref:putative galactinol--sucrose galactosyltransferase 2 isoform X3 n=1 Tax=Castanea sativa TaxID=21020 RepID=UPI003F64EA02